MSRGLIPVRFPPGPGLAATPSIMYNGSLLPLIDEPPRMRSEMEPSAACEITNPGTLAARVFSIGSMGVRSRSSEVTITLPVGPRDTGLFRVGSTNAPFPEAHPERSPTRPHTARRGENTIFAPGTKPKELNIDCCITCARQDYRNFTTQR